MVAILSAVMRKSLLVIAVLLAAAVPLCAEDWSLGVATGPFVFGKFATRTSAIGTEQGVSTTTSRLSAATRPGIAVDVEKDFNKWFAMRLGGTWTYAPLALKGSDGSVIFDAGHIGVTTLSMPLLIKLNRGTFRFHLLGGPAYALYHGYRRSSAGASTALFTGTRGRWGGVVGGGATWWVRSRFGIEGEVSDVITASPFHVLDIAPTAQGVHLKRPENVHTTVGIRYHF